LEEAELKKLVDFIFKGRDSVFLVIDGFNQIGKTDLMLTLMEGMYHNGYFKDEGIGLNQQITNAPFEWKYFTDWETMKAYLTMWGKPFFYFFDELGKSAPKATPWGKINLKLITEFETKRKDRFSMGGCSIGDIDRRIVSPNYLDVYIRKTSLTTAKIHHLQKRATFNIRNIPKTTIGFKQFTPAKFTLEPVQFENDILDSDTRNALTYSRGEKYTGTLAKSSYYESVKRGIAKLYKLSKFGGSTDKLEEQHAEEPN